MASSWETRGIKENSKGVVQHQQQHVDGFVNGHRARREPDRPHRAMRVGDAMLQEDLLLGSGSHRYAAWWRVRLDQWAVPDLGVSLQTALTEGKVGRLAGTGNMGCVAVRCGGGRSVEGDESE